MILGRAKAKWMEDNERGFSVDEDKFVCADCFEDCGIKKFIEEHNTGQACSYCSETGNGSCSLEHALEHIMYCIRSEWGHPADEGLPYETREGGWQGEVFDTVELLENICLDTTSDDLYEDICSALHIQEWCRRNPFSLTEDKTLLYGWRDFTRFVINEARYVFFRVIPSSYDQHQHDEMNPIEILDSLGGIVGELELLDEIEPTVSIKRVQIVECGETISSAKRLGSPPTEEAKIPNRMSPAGIPMFYGAYNVNTAIAETYDSSTDSGKKAVCGHFLPLKKLSILNLSKNIQVQSLFEGNHKRRVLTKFLLGFLEDFTKPIDRKDRSHIDYVPTQIVTEYFRHVFMTSDGRKLDGIAYPSSKDNGQAAVVLFVSNDQCVEKDEAQLKNGVLVLENVTEIPLPYVQ